MEKRSSIKAFSGFNGFTLIELLVVVLIIGILAAVALPRYQLAVGKAKFMNLIVLGDAIHKAEEVYFLNNGTYTNQLSDLDLDISTKNLRHFNLSAADANISVSLKGLDPYYVIYWNNHPKNFIQGIRTCRVDVDKLNWLNKQICANVTGGNESETDYYSSWKF